eukprot:TRINITY_DN3921_c0_g2_i1.p1 TRINITY_DN3921_c0_g2~~TRINITY_DN3921_c0_g2_i1.p1  ORF type:complete len:280 (-),score=60.73 TRINITY_DN3921_c0_g2_i1:143-889(-)
MAFLRPPSYDAPDLQFEQEMKHVCASQVMKEVPGAVMVHDVLTEQECKDIVIAAESIGFYKSAGIGPATKSGKPCPPKVVLVLAPEHAELMFERCKQSFQQEITVHEERWKLSGINPRLRIHKYAAGYTLGPHYDRGEYRASAVDDYGELRFDFYGDDRCSKMSLLIYLTGEDECPSGGQTTFFPDALDEAGFSESRAIKVNPTRGAAVAFFHGDHPQSPLHEGTEVLEGFKYIIRTDVMYTKVTERQ